jgi:predicted P-loop ATPase
VVKVLSLPELSGQHLALDEFLDIIVIAPRGTQDWRPLTDTDYTAMRAWLETAGNCEPIGHEMMRQAAHLVAEQSRTDSAKNWLATLQWDGKQRIRDFTPEYLGVEDTHYARAVGVYLWTALAGRVLNPGCQADMVPVLVGAQGVGKTRGVEAIAPAPEQFGELRIDEPDDVIARKLRGRLIVEMAEMRGVRTAEIERLKAFITRTHERWIPKYMEFATNYPRRAIIVGTTNDEDFLPLDTEHRRWLPIKTQGVEVERIKEDRDQLWAEAAILYTIDGIAWRGMDALAAPARLEAQGNDIWEPLLAEWLRNNGALYHRTYVLLTAALGLDPRTVSRVQELRMAKLMRKMGWEKKSVRDGDKVVKAWFIDPLS